MGGFECLHIIRNNSDLAYIPIIIYSTSGYYSDIEKAQKIGANGYFKKPNDYEHLCAKLEKLLKHQCTEGINPLLCAKLKKLMNGECGGECLAMPSFKFLIT
jgi:PleD family two-component response regulator